MASFGRVLFEQETRNGRSLLRIFPPRIPQMGRTFARASCSSKGRTGLQVALLRIVLPMRLAAIFLLLLPLAISAAERERSENRPL